MYTHKAYQRLHATRKDPTTRDLALENDLDLQVSALPS
jgi:hypothetical protein